MKKTVLALAALLVPIAGTAQTVTGAAVAAQFNNWQASPAASSAFGVPSIAVGTNTVSASPCSVQGDPNHTIPVFSANTPIRLVDQGTPSLSETFTPSSVTNNGCTATFTAVNAHGTNYIFKSGTFGLQEAINATVASGQLNVVELSAPWFYAGGTATILYAATGTPYLTISDITVGTLAVYRWSGTHYVPEYSILGTTNPTLAAGAAAGTGPTVTASPGNSGTIITIPITTGTATTTGTFATATVSTAAVGGNLNCSVQSVGNNSFPAFTVSTSGTVLTVTSTVAPTASTPYVLAAHCN